MNSPEKREAARRLEESLRRSSELCRIAERELRYHSERDDRYWEADVNVELGRLYGLLATAAVHDGLLDRLEEEALCDAADREWCAQREDYAGHAAECADLTAEGVAL